MHDRIFFPDEDGVLKILIPDLSGPFSLEQIAAKDVPFGVPYIFGSQDDVPDDRTFRAAWEADFSEPVGAGADYGAGSENVVVAWNEDGSPVVLSQEEAVAWFAEQERAAEEARTALNAKAQEDEAQAQERHEQANARAALIAQAMAEEQAAEEGAAEEQAGEEQAGEEGTGE